MGGSCSTDDTKCSSIAGNFSCGKCASTCFSSPEVESLEDKLEVIVAQAIEKHLAAALVRMHMPQQLAVMAEHAALELADQISPRVRSAPSSLMNSPVSIIQSVMSPVSAFSPHNPIPPANV